MRVVGVIAEYNPFHLGHAYHLQEAKHLAQADAVVVVMSSCFTQRGEAALLAPADRARMALQHGADAVFALPALWSARDAEHFALGGVALLAGLGCSAISFGTENADASLLARTAAALEAPGDALRMAVQAQLATGAAYPAALSAAMESAVPGSAALLDAPNGTLAVCYLRAMQRTGVQMDVHPVQRQGAYHASELTGGMPSATALRGAILRGDWVKVRSAMPEAAFGILMDAAHAGRLHRPEALDAALAYRLRTMSDAAYSALPDVSEGIEYRLKAAAQGTVKREDLLQAAKTRRYPYARLSRLATHALLGLTDDMLDGSLPDAAWLLGFRQDARRLFGHIKEHGTLPIISKAADAPREAAWFQLEQRAYDLWALGAGLPAGLAMTQGVVRA